MLRRLGMCCLLAAVVLGCSSAARAEVIIVTAAPEKVARYAPFKVSFELPYLSCDISDPAQVKAGLVIKTPSGKSVDLPAFCLSNKRKTNKSEWEARFTPLEVGKYEFRVSAESSKFREISAPRHFYSERSSGKGFLRISPKNPYSLVFDSGESFYGIGFCAAWVPGSDKAVFDRYFSRMQSSGCNITRVWMCDWSFPLEWDKLGVYDAGMASKLDELLDLAAERGIYIILCLDTYGSFMDESGTWGEQKWKNNPYNKIKGGPCVDPEDMFTNKEAKRLYRNKLRYIAARWGYSPNILAFELWNEFNAPAEWVTEMSGYLKSLDPQGQFVTTSNGYPYGTNFDESKIWALSGMDIVTLHIYGDGGDGDLVPALVQKSREAAERYKKPFIVSEFGIDFARDDKENDPAGKGTALHNGIWASAMLKSCGTTMNWWWDTYIRPKELYVHYQALAAFLKGVDRNTADMEYIRTTPITLMFPKKGPEARLNVKVKTEDSFKKIFSNEFIVLNNGELDSSTRPNKYLHGAAKEDMRVDHDYRVNYPDSGKFIIHIGTVSQGAELHVNLDGSEIYKEQFPAGPDPGPWKRSLYNHKCAIYQCVYDKDISIDIPKGRHTVKLSNTGKDWIGIEGITLTGYNDGSIADARSLGLKVGKDMLFWIQNKGSNWKNDKANKELKPIKGSYFDVLDIKDGVYKVELWDTYKGVPISKESVRSENGTLRVTLPEFSRDMACKVRED
jgi:hypothetical protein